mmetsp:Transcript_42644/g.101262  ORF Transcript_42644/g.101262 Transcript_42644/m.101262 type:complete len:218 (+) Transcript_42644:296-949(+)
MVFERSRTNVTFMIPAVGVVTSSFLRCNNRRALRRCSVADVALHFQHHRRQRGYLDTRTDRDIAAANGVHRSRIKLWQLLRDLLEGLFEVVLEHHPRGLEDGLAAPGKEHGALRPERRHHELGVGEARQHGDERVPEVLLARPIVREVSRGRHVVRQPQELVELWPQPLRLDQDRNPFVASARREKERTLGQPPVKVDELRALEDSVHDFGGELLGP